jgi:Cu2+-exporting ATPase
MDDMAHQNPAAVDPHAGHKTAAPHGGHDRHAGHSVAMFRDKFWLSFALTIPVVVWSRDVQHWLGYTAPSFRGSKLIPPILGTVVFVYGGLTEGRLLDEIPAGASALRSGVLQKSRCGRQSAN